MCLTIVLFPDPEGAEKMMTLLWLIDNDVCGVLSAKIIKFADDYIVMAEILQHNNSDKTA